MSGPYPMHDIDTAFLSSVQYSSEQPVGIHSVPFPFWMASYFTGMPSAKA